MSENKLKDLTGNLETTFKNKTLEDEARRKTEPQKEKKEPTFTEIKAQKALEEKKLILTTEIFNEDRQLEKAIKEEEQYLANQEKQAQKAIIKKELEAKAEENKRAKKVREIKGELDGIIAQFKKDWPIEKFENRFLINNIVERYKEIYYIVNSDLEKKKLFIKDYEDFNQNEELDNYFDVIVCEMLYRDYDKQDLIGLVFDEDFIIENVDHDYSESENIAQILSKYEKQKEQWQRDIDYSIKALERNINRLTFKQQTQQLKEELREEAKHQQREEESRGKNEELKQKIEEIKAKREEMENEEPKKSLNQDLEFLEDDAQTVGDILGQIEDLAEEQQKKRERREEIEAVNDLKNKLKKKKEQRKERERQEQLAQKEEEIFKYKWFEETKPQKQQQQQEEKITLDSLMNELKKLRAEVEQLKQQKQQQQKLRINLDTIKNFFKKIKFKK